MEAMIPVEIKEGSPRMIFYNEEVNSQIQRKELDLLPRVRERAPIKEEALKRRMASRYNQKVVQRSFANNNLILIRNDIGTTRPGEGKLVANWKGPHQVVQKNWGKVATDCPNSKGKSYQGHGMPAI